MWREIWYWSNFFSLYINNCPTRCNTKQSIYYSASSLYMFRVSATPIIRSTQNCNHSLRCWSCCAVQLPPSNIERGVAAQKKIWPSWREVAAQKIWPVPEAVVTVLCTPDDGCGCHPKHIQWTCRITNRLLCVASRWTIINPSNAELNPICHLVELLGAHPILHVSRIRVNIDQRCTEP